LFCITLFHLVRNKPLYTEAAKDIVVFEGTTLYLNCISDSDITWKKDGRGLNRTSLYHIHPNSLEIRKIKISDQGNYSCYEINQDTSNSSTIKESRNVLVGGINYFFKFSY